MTKKADASSRMLLGMTAFLMCDYYGHSEAAESLKNL